MSFAVVVLALVAMIFFFKYLNRTDTPIIKNLPEIPGVPLFGNLLQFGATHAKVARDLAQQYGPVFQVRFGNKVCTLHLICVHFLTGSSALYLPTPSIRFVTSGLPISLL